MSFEIHLDSPPAGISGAPAREGEPVPVIYREFTSSEDGDLFVARLEGFPSMILGGLPADAGVGPSTVDHLVAVIRKDCSATVYVNELKMLGKARVRRTVSENEVLLDDDLVDFDELRFEGVDVPADAGVLIVLSQGWRKGMYFDFGPFLPNPVNRDYNLWGLLGSIFGYMVFQRLFKIGDNEWERLIAAGWFPFVGLRQDTVRTLINYTRHDWNTDELVVKVAEEVKARLPGLQEHWQRHSFLGAHYPFLVCAAERFLADDYLSCISILQPRIEGVLRDLLVNAGGDNFKQAKLIEAPIHFFPRHRQGCSRVLPLRFQDFLKSVYFASFDPLRVEKLSRNTVAHGVASVDMFSLKAAAVGFLVMEQILFHVPMEQNS